MEEFIEKGIFREGQILRLYATSRLVAGGAYSAVYDLGRWKMFRFATVFRPLMDEAASAGGLSFASLPEADPERSAALDIVRFLLGTELAFVDDDPSYSAFIALPERWDIGRDINNAIVDVNEFEVDWPAMISALETVQCRSLQIRCYSDLMTLERIEHVLALIEGTCITHLSLLVKWQSAWESLDWIVFLGRHLTVVRVQIHSSPSTSRIDERLSQAISGRVVEFMTTRIEGPHQCGRITEHWLATPTTTLYKELRNFNGCLNRKLSFRADGEICNCPSMKAGFGKDLATVKQIVASSAFQAPWRLRKDEMEVCKGCEFRYVCTDCRAYLSSDLSLEKPKGCGYDPLTGVWSTPDPPLGLELAQIVVS